MSQLLQLPKLYNSNDSEKEFLNSTINTRLDLPMEKFMDHTIFLKYVNLARLEATKRALKMIELRRNSKDEEDENLIKYVTYIKDRYNHTVKMLTFFQN